MPGCGDILNRRERKSTLAVPDVLVSSEEHSLAKFMSVATPVPESVATVQTPSERSDGARVFPQVLGYIRSREQSRL